MFRDKEIIAKIQDVLAVQDEDFSHLCKRINEIEKMCEDIQETCESIKHAYDAYTENVRDDDQVKEILKEAMREFKEEMEKPVKKPIKVIKKK